MDSRETLALYKQGKEVWNEWAREMLSRRDENDPQWAQAATAFFALHVEDFAREFRDHDIAVNSGSANFSGFIFPSRFALAGRLKHGADFDGARFEGWADFTAACFPGQVAFHDAVFMGLANFPCARFESLTIFDGATFKGIVRFNNAVFHENTVSQNPQIPEVSFRRSRFEGYVDFTKARFCGHTSFDRTVFNNLADFSASVFEGKTTFFGTIFKGRADFRAVKSTSTFAFDGFDDVPKGDDTSEDQNCGTTKFSTVPDFQQATFVGAPRLDNVKIESQRSLNISFATFKTFFKGDSEENQRQRARRQSEEGSWRALRRLAVQGHDYASERRFFKEEVIARRGVTDKWWHAPFWLGVFYQFLSNFGLSLSRPLMAWFMVLLGFACAYAYGSDGPWQTAFLLSLHKSLPALSSFSGGLPGLYARLYGVASCDPFRPIIPDSVIVLGIMQTLLSAAMIFLFLLAVRNHFRIK